MQTALAIRLYSAALKVLGSQIQKAGSIRLFMIRRMSNRGKPLLRIRLSRQASVKKRLVAQEKLVAWLFN